MKKDEPALVTTATVGADCRVCGCPLRGTGRLALKVVCLNPKCSEYGIELMRG